MADTPVTSEADAPTDPVAATPVRIRLPIPFDLAGQIIELFGQRWPSSAIMADKEHPLWEPGDERHLVLLISDEDRFAADADDFDSTPRDSAAQAPSPAGLRQAIPGVDTDAFLESIADGTFGMTVPHWFSTMIVGAFRHEMAVSGAENFLTWALSDDELGKWEITVRRPDGKTTGEKLAELNAELARTRAALTWLVEHAEKFPLPPVELVETLDEHIDKEHGTWEELSTSATDR